MNHTWALLSFLNQSASPCNLICIVEIFWHLIIHEYKYRWQESQNELVWSEQASPLKKTKYSDDKLTVKI